MSLTLADPVSETDRYFRLSGPMEARGGSYFRLVNGTPALTDEVVQFVGYPGDNPAILDRTRIYVVRGALSTHPAAHAAGVSLRFTREKYLARD